VASIKSRLTVAQVVQGVKANAIMTFDYIILIIVAGNLRDSKKMAHLHYDNILSHVWELQNDCRSWSSR
jgi:hypothetical protein